MGRDKGLLPFQGQPLVEYILDKVEGLGDETLIITNHPENYQRFGLPLHGDIYPGVGALSGLYSALYHAQHELCLVLACDMPFVNRPLLEHLIALAPGHDAVVPRLEYAKPFRSVYRRTCLEPVREAIERGERRVISFFDRVSIRFVGKSELQRYDPQLRSFFNINTPQDLAEAESLAAEVE